MNKEYTDLKNKWNSLVTFDYWAGSKVKLHPITAKRLVNERIKCTIGAMYFETPTTRLGYVITFIKCIKEFIIREARR